MSKKSKDEWITIPNDKIPYIIVVLVIVVFLFKITIGSPSFNAQVIASTASTGTTESAISQRETIRLDYKFEVGEEYIATIQYEIIDKWSFGTNLFTSKYKSYTTGDEIFAYYGCKIIEVKTTFIAYQETVAINLGMIASKDKITDDCDGEINFNTHQLRPIITITPTTTE